jgi:cellulose synthase/poly-beta-1,6-N-acetylglucosamine synthase-like glycosyltransferase
MPSTWNHNMPFGSIIVPCYNHGHYVKAAIQSVLDQTWHNFEIIVVNDDSHVDETVKILNDLQMPKTRAGWDRSIKLPSHEKYESFDAFRLKICAEYANGIWNLSKLLR